jgi:phosphate-selective porin OprO/OprP
VCDTYGVNGRLREPWGKLPAMRLVSLSLVLALCAPAFAEDEERSELEDPKRAERTATAPVDSEAVDFRPGTGLHVASRDGRFTLALRFRTQIQYAIDNPETDDNEQTLMVRRMRLLFAGRAFHEHVRYYLQFGFSNRDMLPEGDSRRTPIRDVRIDLDHWRDLNFRIGETKVPFSRERLTSSGDLQMVDRSLANEEFNLDRDIGIQALSRDLGGLGLFGYAAGVFLGEGRGAFQPTGIDMLFAGRLEVFPLGKFEHESMVDFARTSPRFALSAGYGYLQNGKRTRGLLGDIPDDGGTTDSHNATADLVIKAYGFSSLFAVHYRKGTRNPGDAVDEMGLPIPVEAARNGWGVLAQAGYLLPRTPYELSVRYTRVRGRGTTSLDDREEIAGGLGWYFADHNIKLQIDYARTWDDGTGADHRVRAQTQIAL